MQRQKMGFPEYIEALEEERLKIQMFAKELPLSLELVSQAIEACRQQVSGTTEYNFHGQSDCSEQTSMEEGPVLEEFIPIKKRPSPDCDDEDDEDEQHSHKPKILKDDNKNSDKRKSDWLRSVQLWNPDPPTKEDLPRKATVVEVKRNGGAFQPFQREDNVAKTNNNETSAGKSASPAPVAAMSSTAGAVTNGGGNKRSEEKDGQGQRKQRRCWSPELHKRFLQALQQLGGPDSATPKQIRELMKVDGLTNDEVKSHLQKFRLHTRRPSPMIHNNATSQTAPFVLVGNIFVQPPEYAAAVATSTASGEVTTVTTPTGIYAPVAAHPPMPPPLGKKAQVKQLEQGEQSQHSDEEERVNHGSEGAVHSNSSPDSSSSTHTTSHSHGY
ncbi:transcription factor HHO3-like [Neltuma alba]|uniref:transcription factor HHO3-like n=1 Tax=Neltuma alba TaxID=207710 RepID=UPI0010A462BF|nr:transcription factor HHO3-like [Prosopis alba]